MSGTQSPARALAEKREEIVSDGEPLHTREREVQENNRSTYHNIPKEAKDLLDIDGSSTVRIDIYRDFYVVRTSE